MRSVDVIIPCFNGARFLPETLDSALSQTYPKVRVVLVDDGSTDATRSVVESYAGRVEYLYKANGGQASARNLGIGNSHADYVCCLDADDLIAPTMIERLVGRLEARPESDLVHASPLAFFSSQRFRGDSTHLGRAETWRPEGGWPSYLEPLSFFCAIHTSSTVLRRRAFDRHGLFPEDRAIQGCEDWFFWLKAVLDGAVIEHVDGTLSLYRQHPTSSSSSGSVVARRESELIARAASLFEQTPGRSGRDWGILSLGMKRVATRWLGLNDTRKFDEMVAASEKIAPAAFRFGAHPCLRASRQQVRAGLTMLRVSQILCETGLARLAAVVFSQTLPGSSEPEDWREAGMETHLQQIVGCVAKVVDAERPATESGRPSFFANAAVALARYEDQARRPEAARERYQQATGLDPENREAWIEAAMLDFRLGNLSNALKSGRRALSGPPRAIAVDIARAVLSRSPRVREFASDAFRHGVVRAFRNVGTRAAARRT